MISSKKIKYIVFSALFVTISVFLFVRRSSYERQIIQLRNTLVEKDKTVEIGAGLYVKQSLELENLRSLLDKKDETLSSLREEVEKGKQQLLTVSHVVVRWKKAYESAAAATQTEVHPVDINLPARTKVDFRHDFGYLGVEGWTLTNPAQAFVRVKQNRPLRVAMAVTQGKDGRWRTYVSSSEENVGMDIALTGVNPWVLRPKWYERLSVDSSFGMSSVGKTTLLGGVGISYEIGKIKVGPSAWFLGSDDPHIVWGANVSWRIFKRD